MQKRTEGFINVTGGNVWYEIVGENKNIPLIVLHGGPGYPHDYLQPLEDLSNEREVIFYDQLGCGNSDKPSDKSLWTVERFVEELGIIVKTLGLKKFHILGQSWGAGLGVAFALTKPTGLKSLILSDPYISTPQWEKDAKRLLKTLPEDMQKILEKEDDGSTEYKQAFKEFYSRFVNRFKEKPVQVQKADNKFNSEIYNLMWGPAEFNASGMLKDFDLVPRLPEIKIPVLLLCGEFDEATPETMKYFESLFPNARSKVFKDSAHFPFWNKRGEYIKTVQDFLKNVE